MKIALFDMDGVLLEAHGYHRALQDTVALLGRALGFQGVRLTGADIAALEACGVTNEWDSATIILALLVEKLGARFSQVSPTPELITSPLPPHGILPPEIPAFIEKLAAPSLRALPPLERAVQLLPERIQPILREAYSPRGLGFRLQQEHVLGSRSFAEIYGLPPLLAVQSYLLAYDRPNITPPVHTRLLEWMSHPHHQAVIFTNRTGSSPNGAGEPSEAELGARCVNLERLPMVAFGGITWLAARRGCDPERLNKPSPVHSLAAMRHALGDPLGTSLESAATLALDTQSDSGWKRLYGAEVWVFEDAIWGVKSVLSAQEILAAVGVSISVFPVSVSRSPIKRESLAEIGAPVYSDLSEALALLDDSFTLLA